MSFVNGRLRQAVSSWPGVSVHPLRFAAREYRFGRAEVGHVHLWGDVDIPFPHPIHDFLRARRLEEQHRWVPNSGWTTFRIRGDRDVEHAIWLMRFSFLLYALKSESDQVWLLEMEADLLHLSPDLVVGFSYFIPAGAVRKIHVNIAA